MMPSVAISKILSIRILDQMRMHTRMANSGSIIHLMLRIPIHLSRKIAIILSRVIQISRAVVRVMPAMAVMAGVRRIAARNSWRMARIVMAVESLHDLFLFGTFFDHRFVSGFSRILMMDVSPTKFTIVL